MVSKIMGVRATPVFSPTWLMMATIVLVACITEAKKRKGSSSPLPSLGEQQGCGVGDIPPYCVLIPA